jgi:5-methylcytosine-specific restriction endonuclease McrA
MPSIIDDYIRVYTLKLQERRMYEIQRNMARTTEDTNKYQEKVNQCNNELEEMSIQNKKSKLEINQVKELDIKKVSEPEVNNNVVKKEKKTKEKIPASVKNTLWSINFDNSIQGNCQCCKTEVISKNNFDCGHIISEKNGGKVHLDNLKLICRSCNSSMGTTNMNDFMTKYGFDKI